jgi:hypothetical protein
MQIPNTFRSYKTNGNETCIAWFPNIHVEKKLLLRNDKETNQWASPGGRFLKHPGFSRSISKIIPQTDPLATPIIWWHSLEYLADVDLIVVSYQARRQWSVVAEWLERRTLNQRVVGSNSGEGTEQDTLKSTARGSQNKQNCLRHVPLTSVKKRRQCVGCGVRTPTTPHPKCPRG